MNVTEVAPAGIVKLAGFGRAFLFDVENTTTIPPVGAGPFVVSVAVAEFPPIRVDGTTVRLDRTTGVRFRVAVRVTVNNDAVIVTLRFADWLRVAMEKVAEDDPAGTLTVAGTDAPAVAERLTFTPPAGAACVRVTVPVTVFPPAVVDGLIANV